MSFAACILYAELRAKFKRLPVLGWCTGGSAILSKLCTLSGPGMS